MTCPCSNIDEMDIDIIIDALEKNQIFYRSSQLNEFKENYIPRLIEKVKKWKKARESEVVNRLEGMK